MKGNTFMAKTLEEITQDVDNETGDMEQNLEALKNLAVGNTTTEIVKEDETPETEGNTKAEDRQEEIKDTPETKVSIKEKSEPIKLEVDNTENLIKIDDNFLKAQAPEIQKYLEGVKGDRMTERALKNYVNAQAVISQKRTPQQTQNNIPVIDKVTIDNAALTLLKQKYPDLPSNNKELTDYVKDLLVSDYSKYVEFDTDFKNTKVNIQREVEQINTLRNSWQDIDERIIKSDVKQFEDKLSEYNLTLQDLGLNLNLDEQKNNKYIHDLLVNSDGMANSQIVEYIYDVPIIRQGSIYNELLKKNMESIIKAASSRNGIQHSNNVVQKKDKLKPPPSLANKAVSRAPSSNEINLEDEDEVDNSSYKDLEKALEKQKLNMFK